MAGDFARIRIQVDGALFAHCQFDWLGRVGVNGDAGRGFARLRDQLREREARGAGWRRGACCSAVRPIDGLPLEGEQKTGDAHHENDEAGCDPDREVTPEENLTHNNPRTVDYAIGPRPGWSNR